MHPMPHSGLDKSRNPEYAFFSGMLHGAPTTLRKEWMQSRTGLGHSSPLSFRAGLSIPQMPSSRKNVAHTLFQWPLYVGQAQRGPAICPRSHSRVQAFSISRSKPLCVPRRGIRIGEGRLHASTCSPQAYRGTDGQRLV